ncbi:UvrD-helicase domain-containing protein [Flavobacterium sp. IB48]|uniref:UvrD-helicase domain-containing protein n=1 Tax=Flavobacterium sp. IB48 TaxID=2779375 RepID=UPI0018E83A89|nr:ATP-dependent helicase [Flavobacterium sp. IB48]MBJ2124362.1 ATP-dependent helicase [Flavobacterium sp. IB48]
MKPIKTDEWIPADGLELEKNAHNVATEVKNSLVVAGPGAGKTELLAQKACFLLQTNTCRYPHKILAISFKRDAASNLKERVRLRCGDELSKRFDSLTFDSFAKQILDRFLSALPDTFRLVPEYDILLNEKSVLEYYRAEDIDFYGSTNKDKIIKLHNVQLPFSKDSSEEVLKGKVWSRMMRESKLSFIMVMRLAEYIMVSNPKIRSYLQQTYQFVFLDEFQDTTEIQYDFFKSCFLGSSSFFTAVGDDKQRIMIWAGARKTVFEDFINEMGAERIPLNMNFRCAPRLVTLLNHLTKHLLGKDDLALPSPKWREDQGECQVWIFENPESEMEILFKDIQKWINEDGIDPRCICILVKQQLDVYAGELIDFFNQNGIKARDENVLQDVLTQELCNYVIDTLYVIFKNKSGNAKENAFNFLRNLHTELEDEQLLKLEIALSGFIKGLREKWNKNGLSEDQVKSLIDEIIEFAGIDRIRANYPHYKNIVEFNRILGLLKAELIKDYLSVNDMCEALDMVMGKDTIPVMTIHKSKGLEYHTVVFIGLEDGAFWSFDRQPDEDKCAFFVALSRAKEKVMFTLSKKRTGRFGEQKQSINKIKVIFDELQKSGIVQIVQRK